MNLCRICRYLVLPLAFVLLFAQQVGAAHAINHALSDLKQGDLQASHSQCEKCADYAQLGNALSVGILDFAPLQVLDAAPLHRAVTLRFIHVPAAVARGPPTLLQNIV